METNSYKPPYTITTNMVNSISAISEELEKYQCNNIDDLLKSHKILMNGLLVNAGKFRSVDVGVGGKGDITHIAPPHNQVPRLMAQLFDWLKTSKEHPLIKSCIFHYEFEFIHPFVDGNGRIGRLWQSVILYNWREVFNAIPIESIVRDNQQKYYDALEEAGSVGQSTPFVEFMLDTIYKTMQKQIEKNKKNVPTNVPIKIQPQRLNKVLKMIQEDKEITALQISNKLKVSEKTVKRYLSELKAKKFIKRVGSTKGGYWKITNAT